MPLFKKIPAILKDKYIISLFVFICWITFFDEHNLISQARLTKTYNALLQEKNFYLDEIRKDKIATKELMTNLENLEKFGRENYLMKRESEDIFLIVREEK